ncbi:MAG: hypothetical protein KatS3mg131_2445 [Candidatus Tectimicrobiota bacterium]|nr:MAG: hypothetical protein KatS3mg131_2445 [Candidatus Tectomicrobia bacterium]
MGSEYILGRGVQPPLAMRAAWLPQLGAAGYRQLLAAMYCPATLRAAGLPAAAVQAIAGFVACHGLERLPRREWQLESDSKSPIYVVDTRLPGMPAYRLVCKWYLGSRQRLAAVEQRMNAYFCQHLPPHGRVGPILAVVTPAATTPVSVALMPYLAGPTLYERLQHLPRHDPQVVSLLRQALRTLARVQVLGRYGHESGDLELVTFSQPEARTYLLAQLERALLPPFAAGDTALPAALLPNAAWLAELLAADGAHAGLYYRGSNPRNIILVDDIQVEIDFEQETLRSRWLDAVTLLENGLELAHWDATADYPACGAAVPSAAWRRRHRRAWAALAAHNYLSHAQGGRLLRDFLAVSQRWQRRYLPALPCDSDAQRQRLLLEATRVFRHLQYVGYCKRNELQALTPDKRRSSRHRQHYHLLWAKCALDRLLLSPPACLPPAGREAATALRRTLDALTQVLQAAPLLAET